MLYLIAANPRASKPGLASSALLHNSKQQRSFTHLELNYSLQESSLHFHKVCQFLEVSFTTASAPLRPLVLRTLQQLSIFLFFFFLFHVNTYIAIEALP
jgi:hypothetical protein